MKTHKIAVDQKMEELDQKLDQERSAAKIALDLPASQFSTFDLDETDFSFNQMFRNTLSENFAIITLQESFKLLLVTNSMIVTIISHR